MQNIIIVLVLMFVYLLIQSRLNKSSEDTSKDNQSEKEQKQEQKKIPFVTEATDIVEGIRKGYADAKKILKESEIKTEEQNNNSEDSTEVSVNKIEFTFSLNEEEDEEIIDFLTDQDDISEYIKKLVRNDLNK